MLFSEIIAGDSSLYIIYIIEYPVFLVYSFIENSIGLKSVKMGVCANAISLISYGDQISFMYISS